MDTTKQPPGKRPEKDKRRVEPESDNKGARERKGVSDGNNDGDSDKPSEEEVISHWKNPITNQDEQEKITNTGGDDIPIADK